MANNFGSSNITTFTANIGDKVKIYRPVGYPAYPDGKEKDPPEKTETSCLGFSIGDENVGKFVDFDALDYEDGYVIYQHDKSGKQVISYKSHALVDITFYIVIQGIVVHDHASIVEGGPAFATYYTEVAANRDQEGG